MPRVCHPREPCPRALYLPLPQSIPPAPCPSQACQQIWTSIADTALRRWHRRWCDVKVLQARTQVILAVTVRRAQSRQERSPLQMFRHRDDVAPRPLLMRPQYHRTQAVLRVAALHGHATSYHPHLHLRRLWQVLTEVANRAAAGGWQLASVAELQKYEQTSSRGTSDYEIYTLTVAVAVPRGRSGDRARGQWGGTQDRQ